MAGGFLFAATVAVAWCGCAAGGGLPGALVPVDERTLGKNLVNGVLAVYGKYTRDSFDRIVSPDFNPVRSEFINGVERGFYGAQQMSIFPIVDSVSANRDLLSVSFRWEKKVATNVAGAYRNLTGRAEYVFKKQGAKWKLYRVDGDDPMTRN